MGLRSSGKVSRRALLYPVDWSLPTTEETTPKTKIFSRVEKLLTLRQFMFHIILLVHIAVKQFLLKCALVVLVHNFGGQGHLRTALELVG